MEKEIIVVDTVIAYLKSRSLYSVFLVTCLFEI